MTSQQSRGDSSFASACRQACLELRRMVDMINADRGVGATGRQHHCAGRKRRNAIVDCQRHSGVDG